MQQPIPAPHPDDDEDVSWALSTASALWSRGEVAEALKWLRRAAETASDANRDLRAVELFKIAAEVANLAEAARSVTPPPPSYAPPSAQYPSNAPGAPGPSSRRPPPGPPPRRSGPPPSAVPAATPTPRTSALPQPAMTPRPSAVAPAPTPRPSAPPVPPPPLPPQTPRPSAVPPSGRSAPPPPPARASGAGSKPNSSAESARVALRRGGPAAVAGTRSNRRDTATGDNRSKARPASPSQKGAAPPATKDERSAFAHELTSERATYAGIGTEARTGDDATTSPHVERAIPAPRESGVGASSHEAARSAVRTRRDEEITVQRVFFPNEPAAAPPYESARLRPGFDDLDEKTNVAAEPPTDSQHPPPDPASERPTAIAGGTVAREAPHAVSDSQRPPSSERTLTGMPAPRDPYGESSNESRQSFRPPPSAAPFAAVPPARASSRGGHPSAQTPPGQAVPPAPKSQPGDTVRMKPAAQLLAEKRPPIEDTDSRETTATRAPRTSDGVVSFKVAVFAADGDRVQLVLLRPGEPHSEGLVTAFVVPSDQASSEAIAALLSRKTKS